MNGSLRIGSLSGIPILIHWTFLIIIPIFAWIIGSQIELTSDLLSGVYGIPIDSTLITAGYMEFILGIVVALGLFAGVLVHEMAHSIVAQRKGIKINSITLLIFGGISSMEEGMPDPVIELPMALVGPLTSLAVGIACSGFVYVSHYLVSSSSPPVAGVLVFVFGYLGILNIFLFAFNLLPAFPMDGGRVLRAFLAKRMPLHKATRIAADVGRIFAVIFGIFGIFLFNPILILIAFFIYIGASQESTVVKYSFLLKDVTVGDMMSTDVMTIGSDLPVRDVIDRMYASKHLGFPVIQNDVLIGIVTLADVHKIPPIDREAMIVKDIMTRGVITLPPSAPVIDALRIMSVNNIGRIPVVDQDHLVGIVTRTDILKVIELKEM